MVKDKEQFHFLYFLCLFFYGTLDFCVYLRTNDGEFRVRGFEHKTYFDIK